MWIFLTTVPERMMCTICKMEKFCTKGKCLDKSFVESVVRFRSVKRFAGVYIVAAICYKGGGIKKKGRDKML